MPLAALAIVVIAVTQGGCYYAQAARGHVALMSKREPIDALIDDPAVAERLRQRLELVVEARAFSIDELGLPDNDSYRSYANLERDYVLWNVFAAPEFSLAPKTWCYPFVGCLGYRGYFKEERARREAERLSADGFDVAVGGVAAYSTLGNFDDPVLNTMMRWDDTRLVGVLFHELAHQVVYIKDDTTFNESFATAVEEIGLERWLASRDAPGRMAAYRRERALEKAIVARVAESRESLNEAYALDDIDERRRAKQREMERLSADVGRLLEDAGRPRGHWLIGDVNNARLIPITLYESRVDAFMALFERCEEQFDCFYDNVKRLGRKPAEARDAELDALSADVRLHD